MRFIIFLNYFVKVQFLPIPSIKAFDIYTQRIL